MRLIDAETNVREGSAIAPLQDFTASYFEEDKVMGDWLSDKNVEIKALLDVEGKLGLDIKQELAFAGLPVIVRADIELNSTTGFDHGATGEHTSFTIDVGEVIADAVLIGSGVKYVRDQYLVLASVWIHGRIRSYVSGKYQIRCSYRVRHTQRPYAEYDGFDASLQITTHGFFLSSLYRLLDSNPDQGPEPIRRFPSSISLADSTSSFELVSTVPSS